MQVIEHSISDENGAHFDFLRDISRHPIIVTKEISKTAKDRLRNKCKAVTGEEKGDLIRSTEGLRIS